MSSSRVLLLSLFALEAVKASDLNTNISTAETDSTDTNPEIFVILAPNVTAGLKPGTILLLPGPSDNNTDPSFNELGAEGRWNTTKELEAVVMVVSKEPVETNDTSAEVAESENSSSDLLHLQEPPAERAFIRIRRSPEERKSLVRKKRTFGKKGCKICGFIPKIQISFSKPQGCGQPQCGYPPQQVYQPPPCGHPMSPCGHPPQQVYQPPPCGHPMSPCGQPPQQIYHPPPPVYHPPPQQTCDPCQSPQQYGGWPYSGSYSESSSSAQSSASSWGKK